MNDCLSAGEGGVIASSRGGRRVISTDGYLLAGEILFLNILGDMYFGSTAIFLFREGSDLDVLYIFTLTTNKILLRGLIHKCSRGHIILHFLHIYCVTLLHAWLHYS